MQTLILYTSNVGSTKAYAEEIAMGIGSEAIPFQKRKFSKMDLSSYDTIVYGGWIKGGHIEGIDEFLSRWDDMSGKNVIVFSVGMGFVSKDYRDNLISSNLLDLYHLRFYPLRGSFDYSKLHFPENMMIKMGIKGATATKDAGTDVSFLEQAMETPFIFKDSDGVDRILSVLHKISSETSK